MMKAITRSLPLRGGVPRRYPSPRASPRKGEGARAFLPLSCSGLTRAPRNTRSTPRMRGWPVLIGSPPRSFSNTAVFNPVRTEDPRAKNQPPPSPIETTSP